MFFSALIEVRNVDRHGLVPVGDGVGEGAVSVVVEGTPDVDAGVAFHGGQLYGFGADAVFVLHKFRFPVIIIDIGSIPPPA